MLLYWFMYILCVELSLAECRLKETILSLLNCFHDHALLPGTHNQPNRDYFYSAMSARM
jgi:hypothetical protein